MTAMTKSLFREGGPHKARRLPGDRYELTISIPTDADGLRGRECPDDKCSPGYFKVKPGTGVVEGQVTAFCPYCRTVAPPDKFTTKEQLRYAKETVTAEAMRGLEGMVAESLGLGSSGRRRIGAGLVSIELSMQRRTEGPVSRLSRRNSGGTSAARVAG